MMMWYMALRLALRSLARSKLRAGLTALGILIGVAAVVTTNSLGAGAKERIEQELTLLGVNLLVVYPSSTTTGGAHTAQGSSVTLTDADALAIQNEVPSVAAVAPVVSANVQVVARAHNAATRAIGTWPGYFRVRAWGAALGSLFTDDDVRASSRACVIGETVRESLFGVDDPVGMEIRVGRMPCVVVGVLIPKGQTNFGSDQDDTVVMPISAFRAGLARLPNAQVNQIMISAGGPSVIHRAQQATTTLLRQRHGIAADGPDDFSVRNLADVMRTFDEQRAAITALLLSVASISLLVGGIGVMNIMLVSVTERTREIGIRLAIGARGSDILAQFLVEAVVLASIGGLAGLLAGATASHVVGRMTQFSAHFQPDSAVLAMAVSGGIGVTFGFFPARRAARLDPIAALRHE
jgi:putative ABC transport system permease protein